MAISPIGNTLNLSPLVAQAGAGILTAQNGNSGIVNIGSLSAEQIASLQNYSGSKVLGDIDNVQGYIPPGTLGSALSPTGPFTTFGLNGLGGLIGILGPIGPFVPTNPLTPLVPTGPKLNPREVATILLDNFDLLDSALGSKDGLFGIADLEAILKNSSSAISEDLKNTISWILANPAVFNAFDVAEGANGEKKDGKISAKDLQTYISNNADTDYDEMPEAWTPETVAQTLLKYFDLLDTASGEKDGGITLEGLDAAYYNIFNRQKIFSGQNPGLPADLQRAIMVLFGIRSGDHIGGDKFPIKDLTLFREISSTATGLDGNISRKDLMKFLGQKVTNEDDDGSYGSLNFTPYRAAQVLLNNIGMLDTITGAKDGLCGLDELKLVGDSTSKAVPQELKDAAKWLLANPTIFNAFDVAGQKEGTDKDGKISVKDLETYLANNKNTDYYENPTDWTIASAAQTLLTYFDLLGAASSGKDGGITVEDLRASLLNVSMGEGMTLSIENFGVPLALRGAIQYLLGMGPLQSAGGSAPVDLTIFNMLETTVSAQDGKITRADLEKFLGV